MRVALTALRPAGIALAIVSLLAAVTAFAVAVSPPAVEPNVYSYPSSAGVFTAYQVLFGLQHLIAAWALLAIGRSGAAGTGALGRVGSIGSAVAMIVLGVLEWVAAGASNEPTEGALSSALNALYGVVTLPLGLFLILLGVAIIRAKVWTGWRRAVVLIAGIWVYFPLTPALAIDFVIARVALILWMLLFAAIGVGLARTARSA